MDDKKLSMEDLDNVAGGVVTGTFNGYTFEITGNEDGSFSLSASGETTTISRDQMLGCLKGTFALNDDQANKVLGDIASGSTHDYGNINQYLDLSWLKGR